MFCVEPKDGICNYQSLKMPGFGDGINLLLNAHAILMKGESVNRCLFAAMHLKKRFGQHFLKDENNAKRVADAVQLWGIDYNHLVEIGPGGGALTKFLVQNKTENQDLSLVEIDKDLINNLEGSYAEQGVRVLNVDFLKADLSLLKGAFGVCGNFPYNISSQILFRVLEHKHNVPEVVGMFQKEVAQRVAALHGSKTYGILSVLVQAYYTVESVMVLKPGAFNPPPKVDSMVIRLKRTKSKIDGLNEKKFFKLVKAAFGQRRKTLRNSIKVFVTDKDEHLKTQLEPILQRRAEQLSVDEFIWLTRQLSD
ncbi:MAG: 16S rRNA (adenine(1518)-N(6)/adenine(1519)-N(6))-dimethyltransferase RsmA [Bacteroidia bacterium]